MSTKRLLVLALLLLWAHKSHALTLDPNRTLEIVGVIPYDASQGVKLLDGLAKTSKEPIYIRIESPGGSAEGYKSFVKGMERLQSQGIEIRCLVDKEAASGAFMIFLACDKRYATPEAHLMFHRGVIINDKPLTAADLKLYLGVVSRLDDLMYETLKKSLKISERSLSQAFYSQRFWSPQELIDESPGWLTIVTK